MDNEKFFDEIRSKIFSGRLTQNQVDGILFLVREFQKTPLSIPEVAYCLATVYWETAQLMQPIEEFGKGAGRKYGSKDSSGQTPYGRGYVQLTWKENYVRADNKLGLKGELIRDYSKALDKEISFQIMYRGMVEGWFTGKKLSDYFSSTKKDYLNARRIINGVDKAPTIASIATKFENALKISDYSKEKTVIKTTTEPEKITNTPIVLPNPPTKTFWGVLLNLLKQIFYLGRVK